MYTPQAVVAANNTEYGSRMYVYEVAGLSQNGRTDKLNYPIRKSGSTFITVPYNRMSQEMQRISRLGGRIVSIKPLSGEGVQQVTNNNIDQSE